jgi:hypothetical protein
MQEILSCLADSAEFSPCRTFRYVLRRSWADGNCIAFLMMNPSTADESINDATIRRCIGFAKRWGYGSLIILNLFSIRSPDPKEIAKSLDPIGPDADSWIEKSLDGVTEVIAAWGCNQHLTTPALKQRPKTVIANICSKYPDIPINCLGYRKDGAPRHPLMLAYETERTPFKLTP